MWVSPKLLLIVLLGAFVRILLFSFDIDAGLKTRVELSTPLTDYKSIKEAFFFIENGLPLYSGTQIHESPLIIHTLYYISEFLKGFLQQDECLIMIFIVCDTLTGMLLYLSAKQSITRIFLYEKECYGKGAHPKQLWIQENKINHYSEIVCAIYLLNIFTLAGCAAQTTNVISNMFVALSLTLATTPHSSILNTVLCHLSLAITTCSMLYPYLLVIPLSLLEMYKDDRLLEKEGLCKLTTNLLGRFALFATMVVALLYASYTITGNSLAFLDQTLIFIVTIPDLTPNVGLYWYLFMELFEHFRKFFLGTVQSNILCIVIPCAIKYKGHPLFMFALCYGIKTLFQTYPSISDLGMLLSLIIFWPNIYTYMNHVFLVANVIIYTVFLMPCMWYMWVEAGSGNANFFYAIASVYNLALGLLLFDFANSFQRRLYDLEYGTFTLKENQSIALK